MSENKPKGITVSQGQIVGVGGLGVVMALVLQAQDLVWTRNEGLENKARIERVEDHVLKVESKLDLIEGEIKQDIKGSQNVITNRLDLFFNRITDSIDRQKDDLTRRIEKVEAQVYKIQSNPRGE